MIFKIFYLIYSWAGREPKTELSGLTEWPRFFAQRSRRFAKQSNVHFRSFEDVEVFVKSEVKISSNLVAFSKSTNFTYVLG